MNGIKFDNIMIEYEALKEKYR